MTKSGAVSYVLACQEPKCVWQAGEVCEMLYCRCSLVCVCICKYVLEYVLWTSRIRFIGDH